MVISLRTGVIGLSLPFFFVGILSGVFDLIDITWSVTLAPVGLVLGVAYGIAYYYRFGYALTDDTVDVGSGVFSRRAREIPYRRIQNVDVRQSVFHRLFDLATLSIETAGGGATEAQLNFVSEPEARRLQQEIRRRTRAVKTRRQAGTPPSSSRARSEATDQGTTRSPTPDADAVAASTETEPVDGERDPSRREFDPERAETDDQPERADESMVGPQQPLEGESTLEDAETGLGTETELEPDPFEEDSPSLLFDLQAKELLLYSLTTIRAAAFAGLLALVFFFTDQAIAILLATAEPFGGPEDLTTGTSTSYLVLGIVSAVNAVIVTYLVSVTYTFATYYDFRLGRAAEDFVYERGLLQRYSGSIPSEKVQSVTITDNPVQRAIGYAGMWVETAGYGPDSGSGSTSAVPLAEDRRVHRFAENLTGVETPKFDSPPSLARRRYLARYSIVATGLLVAAYVFSTLVGVQYWYLAALAYLAVPPAAHLRYVNLGYYVGRDHLVIRRGFWKRRTTIIPYYRIQTISNRRSIFQRRLGLTSVVVDTASSQTFLWTTPTVYDLNLEDGRQVARVSRRRLQDALAERRRDDESGPSFSVDFT